MTYAVLVQRLALQDLESAYQRAARNAPATADRWLERFRRALRTLQHNPQRCPLAREDRKVDLEIREFLFGRRPHVFRVLFTIDGDTVRILRIRRAQRRPLTRRDINQANEPDDYGVEP